MNILVSEAMAALLPTFLQIISAVLGILLIRLAAVAKARWGLDIDARRREALHTAFMSGIRAALTRGLTGDAAVQAAVAHATQSTPDAIKHFAPDPQVLEEIARAKLRELADIEKPMVSITNNGAAVPGALTLKGSRR